jgi:hypothetical protein
MEGTVEARTTRATEPEPDSAPWRVLAQSRLGLVVGRRVRLERVLGWRRADA